MPAGSHAARPGRPGAVFHVSVCCLVLGVLLYRAAYTVADPDLWGHVRFGQDIWQAGSVLQTDPYSYRTAGQRWINHEWLAEVLFALAYDGAGATGLIVLKVLVSGLLLGIAYRHLGLQGLSPLRAGLVLLLASVPLFMGLATVRPHLFTYLLFLLVLLLLHEAEHGRSRWLALAPVLFALWVNLHGGFLAGVAIFGLWALARLGGLVLAGRRPAASGSPSALAVATALIASLLALLLNPYGIELLTFLLRTATVGRPEISEWAPIRIWSTEGVAYLLLLVLGSAGLACSRRERKPALVLLFLCTALLPLLAMRHLPLFALAVITLTGGHLADAWDAWRGEGTEGRAPPPAWLTAANFAAAGMLLGLSLPSFRGIHLEPHSFPYPVRAVALLKGRAVAGNLAIHFDWGEYAIWHLGPRLKVAIDGRRETVYSEAAYKDYWQFWNGQGNAAALLQDGGTELALVSKDFRVFDRLKREPGWLLLYEDPLCGLFVRRGTRVLEALRGTQPPALPYDGQGLFFP